MTKSGKPLPQNALRDEILVRIRSSEDFRSHPAQRNPDGTKYISAFLASKGQNIAIEKNLQDRTPIWILDSQAARQGLEARGIGYDFYAVGSARNSNLKTLPNFRDGALLRTYPRTVDEALEFIASL